MEKRDTTLQVLVHILSLFLGFLFSLVVLFYTKDETVKDHCRKNLNWKISTFIYSLAILSLFIYSAFNGILSLSLACILIYIALLTFNWIFCIIAAVKANKNELWDYPLAIRFL